MTMHTKKISELFQDIKIGGTPSRGNPSFFGGSNLWVSIKDMHGQTSITTTAETISDDGVNNSNCKLVKKGSLLFSFKLTVGRTAFAGNNLYTNEAIAAFDPDEAISAEIDLDFLSLVLPIAAANDNTKNSMGASLLNKEKILGLKIPYPEIIEQRRLAARLKNQLTEVETQRKAIEKQNTELQLLKRKALEAIFNSIAHRQPIGSVSKVQSGYAFKSGSFTQAGVKLLRNTNILPGKVYWDATVCLNEADAQQYPNYRLATGDVLISLDRPIISSGIKVARVSENDLPALLLQRVGRFQINPALLDPDYLYAFLQTDIFISKISGHEQSIGVPHVSPAQIEAIEIPLPDLSTQTLLAKKFCEIINTCSTATKAIDQQLNDITALPQRLLAQAFEPQVNDHA